jgi:YggT family protein
MTMILYLLRVYEVVLLLRVLFSWIRPNPAHPVVQWVYRLTEPVLAPVRRIVPAGSIGIDFSPVVVFVLIEIIRGLLFRAAPVL